MLEKGTLKNCLSSILLKNQIDNINTEFSDFRYIDYLRHVKSVEESIDIAELKPIRLAFLSSYTVEMIEPILKLKLLLNGYNPEFLFGGYNQYAQKILNPSSSLYSFKPDLILIMVRIEELLPDFIDEFGNKLVSEWGKIIENTVKQMGDLVEKISEKLHSQIIFQNMSLVNNPYWGIYDAQQPEGQTHLVNKLNHLLVKEFQYKQNTFIWDFNRFIQNHGYEAVYDSKMWYLAKNPFKQSAYIKIADDLSKYILSAMGNMKKCIVLDLDNTLWGGIAGEDGIDGVALGHDYPGSCYREFQKRLLKFYQRGIILAINSKNNEEDAMKIIKEHPYMILRETNFAAMQINWDDKATNINRLAKYLDIGIDSMIFVDDNPAECELVRKQCSGCEVICIPQKPYLIPTVLDSLFDLENIRLTEDDRKRGSMYLTQVARKQSEKSFNNMDDFIRYLGITVNIEQATTFSIPRITQLIQKTNQMNLTTRRYTETDIQFFVKDPGISVFSVSAKDRFGDNGIVGVFILKIKEKKCIIDTFLLSCRVIGRNIENSMISFIVDFAKNKGAKLIIGEYIPTGKNKPAKNMYEKFQFQKISDTSFSLNLA